MDRVEVVVAHQSRATLRVGDVFLKVDPEEERVDREVRAMSLAPLPTAPVLWRQPPVLALGAVPGRPLARLGRPSDAPASWWEAAGAAVRTLHEAAPPPWASYEGSRRESVLEDECAWLAANDVLPRALLDRSRTRAEEAVREVTPVFIHGDLQVAHVLLEDGRVTGVLDWSEGGQGDPAYDLATLTLGHPEHLGDVLAGYGGDIDAAVIRGWWAMRSLTAIRWLIEHGYDPAAPGCEVDVLKRL